MLVPFPSNKIWNWYYSIFLNFIYFQINKTRLIQINYPEHPLERNYSVVSGFSFMHKILPEDIKNFQTFFDKELSEKKLTFFREDILEHQEIDPISHCKYQRFCNRKA